MCDGFAEDQYEQPNEVTLLSITYHFCHPEHDPDFCRNVLNKKNKKPSRFWSLNLLSGLI